MTSLARRRFAVCLVLGMALLPFVVHSAEPVAKTQEYTGKVVPLAGLLAKSDVKLDADAAPHWLALVTEDKKIYPLIKDDGSRMFWKDRTLLDRPMRITGKLVPGSQLLQALQVHSIVKGELHEVYYWCEVCRIKRFEKKDCECCGAPLEFREEPVKK